MKIIWYGLSFLVVGSIVAFGLNQQMEVLGYGYGYNITCQAERPNNLAATYSANKNHIIFSWDPVTFSGCSSAESVYRMQIHKTDASLMVDQTNIAATETSVLAGDLQSNLAYKFKVKSTAWSLYKAFRTLPAKPTKIRIKKINHTQTDISWENVPRSKKLRYYQLVIKRGSRVIFSKQVGLGLRKKRTGTIIEHLKHHVMYNVKIRAVARKNSKGEYAKKYFIVK
ncbi:MAG: fibronectin type III domain-containing protein [Patescibacteria group bacterium]|jgi:hypothetical protein